MSLGATAAIEASLEVIKTTITRTIVLLHTTIGCRAVTEGVVVAAVALFVRHVAAVYLLTSCPGPLTALEALTGHCWPRVRASPLVAQMLPVFYIPVTTGLILLLCIRHYGLPEALGMD